MGATSSLQYFWHFGLLYNINLIGSQVSHVNGKKKPRKLVRVNVLKLEVSFKLNLKWNCEVSLLRIIIVVKCTIILTAVHSYLTVAYDQDQRHIHHLWKLSVRKIQQGFKVRLTRFWKFTRDSIIQSSKNNTFLFWQITMSRSKFRL